MEFYAVEVLMLLGFLLIVPAILSGLLCWGTGAFESNRWFWLLPVSYVGGFLAALIVALAVILISGLLVDRNKPQEKDSKYFRFLIARCSELARAVLSLKVSVEGMEKIPKTGRFLLVCNHLAEVDPLVLMGCFHKTGVTFVSKQENRDRFLIGQYIHKIRCPLMNRENDREALKTILHCIDMLKEDQASIAVFPEGYIKPDRKLHHFRSGVFKIAQRAKVPVVVCTLQNTQYIRFNYKKLKKTHIYVHLLDVVTPEQYEGMSTVELGNMIYEIMARDLGPENVSNEV